MDVPLFYLRHRMMGQCKSLGSSRFSCLSSSTTSCRHETFTGTGVSFAIDIDAGLHFCPSPPEPPRLHVVEFVALSRDRDAGNPVALYVMQTVNSVLARK